MNADPAAAAPEHGHRDDHVVGFYERDVDLAASVARFLSGALDDGGAGVVIATAAHRATIADALAGRGYSLTDLTTTGRYRAFDASETLSRFMRGDGLDHEAFRATVAPILDEMGDRNAPLHAFGEMVGLLWDAGNVTAAIELERYWNALTAPRGFALYCAYAMSSIEMVDDIGAAKDLCDQHSDVVALHDPLVRVPHAIGPVATDSYDRLFIATPSALSRVRTFVREALRTWGDDELFDVAGIIAAELATNAMVHAHSPFRVRLARSPAAIRIAVHDTSLAPPEQLDFDHTRSGGRGIAIVAALARTWGTQPDGRGKVVWAELARDPAYSAP
jgi:anti-sigma regulatory factor (Ser/Thr protein kinase)